MKPATNRAHNTAHRPPQPLGLLSSRSNFLQSLHSSCSNVRASGLVQNKNSSWPLNLEILVSSLICISFALVSWATTSTLHKITMSKKGSCRRKSCCALGCARPGEFPTISDECGADCLLRRDLSRSNWAHKRPDYKIPGTKHLDLFSSRKGCAGCLYLMAESHRPAQIRIYDSLPI